MNYVYAVDCGTKTLTEMSIEELCKTLNSTSSHDDFYYFDDIDDARGYVETGVSNYFTN
jgi:hypothetical protein